MFRLPVNPNFIFGIIGSDEEKDNIVDDESFRKTNRSTIAAFLNKALGHIHLTWLIWFDCNNTCLARELHRLADLNRSLYPAVNTLICSV